MEEVIVPVIRHHRLPRNASSASCVGCQWYSLFRPVYPAAFVKLFDIRQFHCCEYRFIPMEAFYVSIYSIVDRMGE